MQLKVVWYDVFGASQALFEDQVYIGSFKILYVLRLSLSQPYLQQEANFP